MPNAAALEATDAARDEADGLAAPQRYWAIATIVLAVFMSVLDSAIANIALPTIARELEASAAGSIWVVNAYQLAITILLLPFASLGEILGYRRVYVVGLAIFTVASLCCALAPSLPTLALARVLQGMGAAGIMSVNGALVRFIYPRRLIGRGIGMVAVVVAIAAALGPTVAAAILAVASWHWLFAVNLPAAVVALAAARALPRNRGVARRFDGLSALLNALFFGLLIITIDGAAHGQGAALIAAEAVGAVAAGVALVLRQLPQSAPLLPVDLLRIPLFTLSLATSVCSFTAQMLAYVALPFYFEDILGRTHVETGLLMTPWPLTTGAMALIAGRLGERCSAGVLGGIGLALFASGLALLALLPAAPSGVDIIWRMVICGFGFGLFQTPNNRAIITSAPRERSGGASGMLPTARLLGQTTGAALAALMFALFAERATTIALVMAATIAAVAAGVSVVRVIERA
jgi:DHA2 family multidrug resistance protein-like MFS transporter